MDLEDADALAVGEHTHDAVTGHRPTLLELDGQIVFETANGQHLRLFGLAAAATRPAKLEADHLGEVEPALLGLAALAAPALARGGRRVATRLPAQRRGSRP